MILSGTGNVKEIKRFIKRLSFSALAMIFIWSCNCKNQQVNKGVSLTVNNCGILSYNPNPDIVDYVVLYCTLNNDSDTNLNLNFHFRVSDLEIWLNNENFMGKQLLNYIYTKNLHTDTVGNIKLIRLKGDTLLTANDSLEVAFMLDGLPCVTNGELLALLSNAIEKNFDLMAYLHGDSISIRRANDFDIDFYNAPYHAVMKKSSVKVDLFQKNMSCK